MLRMVLFFCFSFSSALNVFNNAKFEPNDIHLIVDNITQVYSQMDCACLCFTNVKCLTATYFGVTQYCILFMTPIQYGNLSVVPTSEITSVLTFRNKTLPAPSKFTYTNETIYGIWNTTVGGDSYPSLVGYSVGDYVLQQSPAQAFDGDITTKYLNFGTCNATVGGSTTQCGQNTGLYLSPQGGVSLLLGFRFCTADSYPLRDPIVVTIEGSNQPLVALTLGSSWILIYNGSSGLDTDPGRFSYGITQWILNNSIWYTSYRLLTTSKRGGGNFVQYSELELLSY